MKVLIVDDSVVFRSQIRAALEGQHGIEVAGTASNGKLALQRLQQLSADVVTLDMEMPEMGGVETIREIRKGGYRVRIIVLSAHTTRGSEMTLEALAAGADDFIAKPSGDGLNAGNAAETLREQLLPKILQFRKEGPVPATAPRPAPAAQPASRRDLDTFLPSVIVVGSSTGGPPALELLLKGAGNPPRCPILVAQHMPPVFTASLARRLRDVSGIPAKEAAAREKLANQIYVAPGDFHLTVRRILDAPALELDKGPPRNSVRPAVDALFESAAQLFGPRVMAFLLTGMGEDGLQGCRAVKAAGGGVAIQSRESCVVFGMPGSVFQDGCYDGIGDLPQLNQLVRRMTA